ncbi:MAG: 4Fe-4S ferredoxin [candidate division Zixibacteria bacterium]|nr:4Fe-4S ferredoxin [candidate division Zixibacteria bacterium]MBU1469413.1 4Fe-4S ferredoxin [candidate division Zixibacteria bacterium]MBU2624167.1 4Fe-4S ferredoxin [candidate division Zixibacteria bacterium]
MTDKPEKAEEKPPEKVQTEAAPAKKGKGAGSDDPLTIFYHWCKACNICIAFCPQKVFEPDRDGKPQIVRPRDCSQCAFCWLHCPDLAIISNEK